MSKKRRKKRKSLVVTVLMPLLILVLIFGGSVFVFANYELSKINKAQEETTENDDGTVTTKRVSTTSISLTQSINNVLLIGQDRRSGEDRARSDSMILCSINSKTGKITLISFMRDMYVEIPGYGSNRINAAYTYGGMALLDETIENNFGVQIDANIEVDFEGFMDVIDTVGGIDIELNAEEAAYLNENNTGLVDGTTTGAWSLTEGVNTLTAEQALAYARTRYVGNSDYERTERQRKVIMAIVSKLKNLGVSGQLEAVGNILPTLTTDMSNMDMITLGALVVMSGMNLSSESYRIPVDGTYQSETISDMQVLVPDLEANKTYLNQYLNN